MGSTPYAFQCSQVCGYRVTRSASFRRKPTSVMERRATSSACALTRHYLIRPRKLDGSASAPEIIRATNTNTNTAIGYQATAAFPTVGFVSAR